MDVMDVMDVNTINPFLNINPFRKEEIVNKFIILIKDKDKDFLRTIKILLDNKLKSLI